MEKQRIWEKILLVGDAYRSLCNSIHTPEQIKEYYGLTIVQMKAIKRIKHLTTNSPDGMGLKKLADDLEVSAATASELVDTLVKKDWLVREQSQVDRRAVCIKLSPKTTKIFENVHEFFDKKTSEYLKDVDDCEIDKFANVLDSLLEKMDYKG